MNMQNIYEQMLQIWQNHQQMHDNQSKIAEFLRQNIPQKDQNNLTVYRYVWELIYGKEQFESSQLTEPRYEQKVSEQPKFTRWRLQPSYLDTSILKKQDSFRYVSKAQAVAWSSGQLILVNPNILPSNQLIKVPLIVILTTSEIPQMISYLRLKKIAQKQIKFITLQSIYIRLQKLINFIAQLTSQKAPAQKALFIKSQQFFYYGNMIFMPKQVCWYAPAYDLALGFMDQNKKKQLFLVQSQKLQETKLLYFGWKKGYYSQQKYQQYIRQWDNVTTFSQQKTIFELPIIKSTSQKTLIDWFLQYSKKQLIKQLQDRQKDDVFECCQLAKFTSNQIIYKKGYQIDFVYIFLQGQFQIIQSSIDIIPIGPASLDLLYGLNQIKKKQKQYRLTLRTRTQATVIRLQSQQLTFHLYDRLF